MEANWKFVWISIMLDLNVHVLSYLRQNTAALEKRMIFVLLTCFECDREEFWIKRF